MNSFKCFLFFLICVLISSCSSVHKIQTRWDYPQGAKIRILQAKKKSKVIEREIPSILELNTTSKYYPYYVEIYTRDGKRLYGTLEVFHATQVTELSNIKIVISEDIIQSVMNDQVAKLTINDPSEGYIILRLNLGNRIPSAMQKLYNKAHILPY